MKGIKIEHYFSKPGVNPFDELQWEKRSIKINNDAGDSIFQQDDVEVPVNWSQLAAKVVASKYFYGDITGTGKRENSIKQIIERVCKAISNRGLKDGYFKDENDRDIFCNELIWLCVNQYASFNSPVWFNVGLYDTYKLDGGNISFRWDEKNDKVIRCNNSYEYPQASACFIQSVKDCMEDIMRLAVSEAMLFKFGSGSGTDLSTLRSSKEKLSGGGKPSGPISFMKVYDQIAAVIKSGGKTRRAAKMQSLKVTHPDIKEFINCKSDEEKKAWALIESGYNKDNNNEAYDSIKFQNANLSVRVTDEFMEAVQKNKKWFTYGVTTGQKIDEYKAVDLMKMICESARICGDPGLQYDTTINKWHTCPNSGRINASNPCGEYNFIDESACNLASINLMKFFKNNSFDVEGFKKAVRLIIIAQDILIDNSSYPIEDITKNSHRFRPLGLGYANLGSLVMAMAMPYDSDEARTIAGVISAIMTGTAYLASNEIALVLGTFDEFKKNKDAMIDVLNMHKKSLSGISDKLCPVNLKTEATEIWKNVIEVGDKGFRNAQVTVLAPTGTIGFMMDCSTTGIEPDIALVKYKLLSDGGMLKLVNSTVSVALEKLCYELSDIVEIKTYIDKNDMIEGAPKLKNEHLPIFDCAFKPKNGKRCIPYMAHVKMMAAVQPFISGAISKTVNMPNDATAEQIQEVFTQGWKMGLKSITIYRDGSKMLQPISTKKHKNTSSKPFRKKLPDTRNSVTHKFSIDGHEGYFTVGLYEDGQPGELFITMAKEGSTVGGLMDVVGTFTSISLQYGVPLITLVDKFRHTRFEPSGMSTNKDIPFAKSIIDYIFCWIGCRFIQGYAKNNTPNRDVVELNPPEMVDFNNQFKHFQDDAPPCDNCGSITVRNGSCYKCFNCGNSMGCS